MTETVRDVKQPGLRHPDDEGPPVLTVDTFDFCLLNCQEEEL